MALSDRFRINELVEKGSKAIRRDSNGNILVSKINKKETKPKKKKEEPFGSMPIKGKQISPRFKSDLNLVDTKKTNFQKLSMKKINIIEVNYNFSKAFEKISHHSHDYLNNCFLIAIKLLNSNNFSGLINGPISKKTFLKNKYLGITEYLANKTNRKGKEVMLIFNKKLSVSPLTTHLPLKEVHRHITKEKIIKQVKSISEFFIKNFKKKPNIAITGLNPHCESNYKSSEEDRIIKPAIKLLIKKKYKIHGPFAADTIFLKDQSSKYDVIIGMYHDQVLTPIKTLFGFDAINITLGLPFVRISPDHGPNENMLGKNLSNPTSLIRAIKFLDK